MAMALRSPLLLALFLVWFFLIPGLLAFDPDDFRSFIPLVTKENRRTVVSTESGTITAVDVYDVHGKPYHLQFIALEPSSLFLPVLLHTDMVFYVQTGRGAVSWVSEDSTDGTKHLEVERGDIYRIKEGSVFYVRSHPDAMREKLRIHAIFNNFNFEIPQDTFVGAYSNISDLVRGFDDRVLQMGFKVSEEVVQAIKWAENPPSIVHFEPNKTDEKPNWNEVFEAFIGRNPISIINGKKKDKGKTRAFNVFKESPDVENCNGWSIAVTNRDLRALRTTDIGVFMVNLTKGSMMGPHWNPKATEIAVVLQGRGMVQVVCPSNPSGEGSGQFKCQNTRLRVKEGDVFVVPRFHPVAQMSFNNDSLVFMGFSTTVKSNHPQYLAGKRSVLQIINRNILAMSFGTSNITIEKFLASQDDSIMLDCTSCAEEAEEEMQKEIERQKQEEARKREEEAARKRQEEEEARKREEEEARKKEEEARKREEDEAKKREQEEARKRAEEEAKKREEEEEEARRRKQEEEASRRQEEEAARRREQEEEERRKEEEAAARRQEEEEAARRREQEEEAARRQEEAARRREKEEAARRQEKEEEAARREEEETRRKEEEEETRRRQEEEARKEEEVTRRQEEEIRRQEEEEIRRQEEEAAARAREEQAPGKEGGEERLVEQEARKQEKAERGTDEMLEQETTKGGERIVSRKMWSI